jgi:hypothetical protein
MKVPARRVLDEVIVANQRCLGAMFCSYTFDPVYFEDHVLRAVLRLSGDPDEDAGRYHEEARAALREAPVACFVDASVRGPGRRLPYDLHLVRARTFHPKVSLVLYETEARLAVGSGNLTRAGLERNTELFFHRTLRYDSPVDAALLRAVEGFFTGCAALCVGEVKGFADVRAVLQAYIAATPRLRRGGRRDLRRYLRARRPDLALRCHPCRSDDHPRRRAGTLLRARRPRGRRRRDGAHIDHRPARSPSARVAAIPRPRRALGRRTTGPPLPPAWRQRWRAGPGLWAVRGTDDVDGDEVDSIAYVNIASVGPKQVELRGNLDRRKYARADLEALVEEGRLWPVPRPTVHAPGHILRRLAAELPVALWLHPSATLDTEGRPATRPLHAKAFLVTVTPPRADLDVRVDRLGQTPVASRSVPAWPTAATSRPV